MAFLNLTLTNILRLKQVNLNKFKYNIRKNEKSNRTELELN